MRGCFSYLDVQNFWIIASHWYDCQMCLLKVTFITASIHNTPKIPRDPKHSNHATSRPKSLLLPLFKTAISALLTTCSVSNNCCSAIILYHVESWDDAIYHLIMTRAKRPSRYHVIYVSFLISQLTSTIHAQVSIWLSRPRQRVLSPFQRRNWEHIYRKRAGKIPNCSGIDF